MKVLFLCTHNRCRSVIAEALARHLDDPQLEAASAGSAPAGEVHPLTLHYLKQAGVDTQALASKGMDDVRDFDPDLVLTLCDSAAGEACPLWLGTALRMHWGIEDPSQAPEGSDADAAFGACIDTLRERVATLAQLANLVDDREALKAALQEHGAV